MIDVEVVIVSGVRTAIGTMGGTLKEFHQHDLGGLVIQEAVKRSGIDPSLVDEVIVGNVGQIAESGFIARVCMLKAGLLWRQPHIRLIVNAVLDCRRSIQRSRPFRPTRQKFSLPVARKT